MSEGTDPQDQWSERLAAADPARNLPDADLADVRSRVLAEEADATVIPLHRRRGLVVAGSAAAGVLLLAGAVLGGMALGRSTAPVAEAPAVPATEESIPVVGDASPPLASVDGSGPRPAVPGTAQADTAAESMIYPGFGVTLIPSPNLPNEPGTARGYRLDGADVDRETLAALLAETFGVDGTPIKQEWGDWRVGSDEASSVWVSSDSMVSWSYWDSSIRSWDCEPIPVDEVESTEPTIEPEACLPDTPPPGTRDAVKQSKALLSSLGVSDDPALGTGMEWESTSDEWTTWVTAWQLVDGQRTQLAWSFSFSGEGLMSASGFAAGLEPVPAYPIVGARTAVLRSSDPRYAAFGPSMIGGGGIYPMAEAQDMAAAQSGTDTAVSSGVSADSVPAGDPAKVQLWWDPAEAISAQLTLAQYWQPDGTLLVLPAYEVETADDRGTWALIAVADAALEFIAP